MTVGPLRPGLGFGTLGAYAVCSKGAAAVAGLVEELGGGAVIVGSVVVASPVLTLPEAILIPDWTSLAHIV